MVAFGCNSIRSLFFLVFPTIGVIYLYMKWIFNLIEINDSNEIYNLVYVKLMIFLMVCYMASCASYSLWGSIIFLAAIKKRKVNMLKAFKITIICLLFFDLLVVSLYYYFNKQSQNNLNLFLNEKVKEVNENDSLSLETMNKIQMKFGCCGFNDSSDYLKPTVSNSCHGLEAVTTTTQLYSKQKNLETKPTLNSGCFKMIMYHVNNQPWIFFVIWFNLCLFKLIGISDVRKFYRSQLGEEGGGQVEQPLMPDYQHNATTQTGLQVGFQANVNQPVYEPTTQPLNPFPHPPGFKSLQS